MSSGENNNPDIHIEHWRAFVRDCRDVLDTVKPWAMTGRLTRVAGLVMEAVPISVEELQTLATQNHFDLLGVSESADADAVTVKTSIEK